MYLGFMLVALLQYRHNAYGQQKSGAGKSVCSSKPSRTAMISTQKGAGAAPVTCTAKNKLCCKGTLSRSAVLASAARKRAAPVHTN